MTIGSNTPIVGIIAEYDPMHNGHIYHLEKAREVSRAAFVVVAMSGDFTQRGTPAFLDKWARSRIAVEKGADLVVELPFAYACNSASYFAYGGVKILEALGCTHLAFGAETDDLAVLEGIAGAAKDPSYEKALQKGLSEGLSFAAAHGRAIESVLGEEAALAAKNPNDLLAVEYLKQIDNMKPVLIHRETDYHGSAKEASAEGIRREVREFLQKNCEKGLQSSPEEFLETLPIPKETKEAILEQQDHLGNSEALFDSIRTKLLTAKKEDLAEAFGCREGMENRLLSVLPTASGLEELVEKACTKRYTKGAVRRMLMHMLTGFRKEDLPRGAESDTPKDAGLDSSKDAALYARILAVSREATVLLRYLQDREEGIPLITKVDKDRLSGLLALDVLAADLYNVATARDMYAWSDLVKSPVPVDRK